MPTLQVKKGDTKKLPSGDVFTVGVGWDPAPDQSESPDLDVWVLRMINGGAEPIYWGNEDWHRPDLGSNSEGNPWVATPEEDVVYQGDDRTGGVSDTGYDEITTLTLSKAPAGVSQYAVFVTFYDDPEVNPPSKTLGMASNITCGVKNEATGNELQTNLEGDHAFDVTVLICTIDRAADGSWSMHSKQQGYTDSMITVAQSLGVKFGS